MKYNEYKSLNLPLLAEEVLTFWEEQKIFKKASARVMRKPLLFFMKVLLLQTGFRAFTM